MGRRENNLEVAHVGHELEELGQKTKQEDTITVISQDLTVEVDEEILSITNNPPDENISKTENLEENTSKRTKKGIVQNA